jgi:hypothetical protein
MIFDVNLGENYRQKALMVANGSVTNTLLHVLYSSVVSRDLVRIAFLIAGLNGLDVRACDIQNAYLTAPPRERCWTVAGPEFGSESGEKFIIVRALYGLKSSGAAFRSFLAEMLRDIGYVPSLADLDVWLRPAVKADGFEYYEMVLCYVDDVLAISHQPDKTMNAIRRKFTLKDDKVQAPDSYLGAQIGQMTTVDGYLVWTQSSDKYIAESVKNVEEFLKSKGNSLPSKCLSPLRGDYKPELETSAELGAAGVQYYQELIGILRWACELGRLDILFEVSRMSAHLAAPQESHLEQVIHIFGYLKKHPKRKIAFDYAIPRISEKRFTRYDWQDFYRDAEEAIPPNMPVPRGHQVTISCFVDADLAGNSVSRQSQTGVLVFVNKAPILWYSKRQNSVEASTYGSEITAMKTAIEMIEALRYKLRMFGVPIDGPANVFCDNEAVYKNCSIPESTLKKKHHSIAYHRNREAVAAGTVRLAKEDTKTNLADVFTKTMAAIKKNAMVDMFMY